MVRFGKFQIGQFDFEFIPFREQIKNQGPRSNLKLLPPNNKN
jgi:hypothetical protein